MDTKQCNICKEIKTLDNFYKHTATPDGFQYKCKECVKDYNEQYKERKLKEDPTYFQRKYERRKIKSRKSPPGSRKPTGNDILDPVNYDVDPETNCWVWKWCTLPTGYARINNSEGSDYVARLVVNAGPGEDIRHSGKCVSRACINPDHIVIGTKSENTRDIFVDGKHGVQKLKAEDIPEIFRLREECLLEIKEIARRYGVLYGCIYHVLTGRTWYWLSEHHRH